MRSSEATFDRVPHKMKMTMTNKMENFIALIREGMEYISPNEEDGGYLIKLYEDTLTAKGFSKEDIEGLLKILREDGLIETQQVFYAPKLTSSTYNPDAHVKGQTIPDENYNKPVYYLHINKEKLEPAVSKESFSFDVETGLLHFQGKICELPLKQIEYYVFNTLYTKPIGTHVSEDDIETAIDLINKDSENSSRIYDAHRRINRRAKEELGITRLIGYKNANYWINKP